MKDYINKVLITIGIIIAIIVIPLLLYYMLPLFTPFIIAYLLALMLEPMNKWLTRYKKISRILAVNMTYFLFLSILTLLSYFAITKITKQIIDLIQYIQNNLPIIETWLLRVNQQIQDFILSLPDDWKVKINQTLIDSFNHLASIDWLSAIGLQTVSITAAIPNFFIILLLILISLYLFSLNLPNVNHFVFHFFKEDTKEKVDIILEDLRKATIGFIHAQIIISSITYIIIVIALVVLGVKYALAVALIIVVVDILPILGTGSVLVPWAIYALTTGNAFLAIGLIVLYMIIIVVRRIIEPKILGERIGLSPLTTLISLWIGFKVMGIIGIFVGPLVVILLKALIKAGFITYKLRI